MIGIEKIIEKAKRDKKVMESLINFCQEKIRKFSLPYLNRCLDKHEREDLVSAANLGFLKAVKNTMPGKEIFSLMLNCGLKRK